MAGSIEPSPSKSPSTGVSPRLGQPAGTVTDWPKSYPVVEGNMRYAALSVVYFYFNHYAHVNLATY